MPFSLKSAAPAALLAAPLAVLAAALPHAAAAQAPQPPAPVVREAMTKLHWLIGDWRGEGWRAGPDGRETFEVTEKVDWALDGLVLKVNGRGWSVADDGEIIEGHNAFGVFSYDAFARAYHFDAFVKDGYQTRTQPEVMQHHYRWSHTAGPGAEMRYHARLTEDGEWIETGERCAEDVCVQTFEMRLRREGGE